jgi:proteasome accessory factor A
MSRDAGPHAAQVVFGVERELAVAVFDCHGQRSRADSLVKRLIDLLAETVPAVPDRGEVGYFLSNGGRVYRDCGHPEICTPEVASPDDLVAYLRACEALVHRALLQFDMGGSGPSLIEGEPSRPPGYLGRSTICYTNRITFGAHETYTTDLLPEHPEGLLDAHLASRVIFTGAGGLDCHESAFRFVLSPRCVFLGQRMHGPLAGFDRRGVSQRRRCHVVAGDAPCSDLAQYLSAATTALVLYAWAAGGRLPQDLQLVSPGQALETYAGNFKLRGAARNQAGRLVTAWEVQRGYLDWVSQFVDAAIMPAWAGEAIACWSHVLEQLQPDRKHAAGTLDWAIKEQLFRAEVERRGLDWDEVATGQTRLKSTELRDTLCMLDVQFAQIGPSGLFAQLDAAGVLDHRAIPEPSVTRAMGSPPAEPPRARVRGEMVREFAAARDHYRVGWNGIDDLSGQRQLVLASEFDIPTEWRSLRPLGMDFRHRSLSVHEGLVVAKREMREGKFAAASDRLRRVRTQTLQANGQVPEGLSHQLTRLIAWCDARCGRQGGVDELDLLQGAAGQPLWLINDYLYCYRFGRLLPDVDAMRPWLELGEPLANADTRRGPSIQRELYFEHLSASRIAEGRPTEAVDILSRITARCEGLPVRFLLRVHWLQGEAMLLQHDAVQAARMFARAEQSFPRRATEHMGDGIEYLHPAQSSLYSSDVACRQLEKCAATMRENQNLPGAARCLLLMRRRVRAIDRISLLQARFETLIGHLPGWQQDPLVQRIRANWDRWGSASSQWDRLPCARWGDELE